jgi:hypothetical protein
VLDSLARCHEYLNEQPQLKNVYLSGLKTCDQGDKGKDAADLAAWRKYFSFRLAAHHLQHGTPDDALETLCKIESDSTATAEDKVRRCGSVCAS